jgi:O-antigen biosynthesis protein WbqV
MRPPHGDRSRRSPLDIRDPAVLHELLGRPSHGVSGGDDRWSYRGKRVLITGAGGSVGSEIARHIAASEPATLALVDHSEYALFRIEQELRERAPHLALAPVLADVARQPQIERVIAESRPDVVFHAAAYKHVSMLERDVVSALRVNVLGSVYVARACRQAGTRLVLISSDKAANARSVMGASKRMSELAVLAESSRGDRVAIVRFGNVLGSSGSVLELMVDRIRRGQPLQVTDRLASRYFMSPGEAVSLVFRADRVARTGQILWLEMGEAIVIMDLARRLLRVAAAAGLAEVPIEIIGLRPGEKLREELSVQGLELLATAEAGVWVARQRPVDGQRLRRAIRAAETAVRKDDRARALRLLCRTVPEYDASVEARRAAEAPGVADPASPRRRSGSVGRPSGAAVRATA